MTFDKILAQFEEFRGQEDYQSWYFGITSGSELDDRIRVHHNVAEIQQPFNSEAVNNHIACKVVEYFRKQGADGDPNGGDKDDKIVYAYLKTATTNP